MTAFAWGLGKSGQLGNGKQEKFILPQEMIWKCGNKKHKIVEVESGALYTCVLTSKGELYSTGCGKYERLGTGQENDAATLTRVPVDGIVVKFSCGIWHGCAVTDKGKLWGWGNNKKQILGAPTQYSTSGPIPIDIPGRVIGVSCGNNFTLVWTENGSLYSWGSGRHGVLGHGDFRDKITPTKVEELKDIKVVSGNAGFAHCGVVTDCGDVYMFGKGIDGELGLGSNFLKDVAVPTKVPSLGGIKELSCNVGEHHGHTLAISLQGDVYTWGDGYKGKLGTGNQDSYNTPQKIPRDNFSGDEIMHVSAGGIHSAAVSKEGRVFTWGCGSDGRLGHPEDEGHRYLFRSDIPRVVDIIQDKGKALGVTCSYYHTACVIE